MSCMLRFVYMKRHALIVRLLKTSAVGSAIQSPLLLLPLIPLPVGVSANPGAKASSSPEEVTYAEEGHLGQSRV
jgi:hypothetical protein